MDNPHMVRIDESLLIQSFMCSTIMRLRELGWTSEQAMNVSEAIMYYIEDNKEQWREGAIMESQAYVERGKDCMDVSPSDQVTKVVMPSYYSMKGFEYAETLNKSEIAKWN